MKRVIPIPPFSLLAAMLGGLALCLAALPALAETSLDKMLQLDDQVAIKKLQDELSGAGTSTGGYGTGVGAGGGAMAPARSSDATAARVQESPPKLTAAYGTVIDGRADLRGVITWDQMDYPVTVGSEVRGYKVTSISTHGAVLSSGRTRLEVPLDIDVPVAHATANASATAQPASGPMRPSSTTTPIVVPMASLMRGAGSGMSARGY